MKKLLIILTVIGVLTALASCGEHTHTPGEAIQENVVYASCGEGGYYDSNTYCTGCGVRLTSEHVTLSATGEHTEASAVIRGEYSVVRCECCGQDIRKTPLTTLNHVHTPADSVIENAQDATCTSEGGYDAVIRCSVKGCGFVFSTETVKTPVSSHVADVPFESGDYMITKCSVCSEVISEELIIPEPHEHIPETVMEKFVSATCMSGGSYERVEYCSVPHCHEELSRTLVNTNMISHVSAEPKQDLGMLIYNCIYCNIELMCVTIPTDPVHSAGDAVLTTGDNPTCTESGEYTVTVYCSIEDCEEHIYESTVKYPPLGHSYVGGVCMVCGDTISTVASSGFKFALSSDKTYYSVIGINAPAPAELIIPATYNGLPVKAVADGAFYDCDTIESVILSDGIEIIGKNAFRECDNLVSIFTPDSVTTIGDYAFMDCDSMVGFTVTKNVTSIGRAAFAACDAFVGLRVAETNPVYRSAFGALYSKDMKTLIQYPAANNGARVTIPSFLESVGDYAFSDTSFDNVILPDTIKIIGDYAFANSKIERITLPSGLISIGNYAFSKCAFLTEIDLPDTLTDIGEYAFSECFSLTEITLPEGVGSVSKGTFAGCISLDTVTLHNQVTSIGTYAFKGCVSLIGFMIPESLVSIDDYAFADCINLVDIYYVGDADGWFNISVGEGNFNNPNIYYVSIFE